MIDEMAPRKNITTAKLKAALKAHAGILSLAADALGVSRQAVHQRVARSPALEAYVADIRAELKDIAEGNIVADLKGGDGPTSRWFLERQARERGYGTRVESEHRLADDQLQAIIMSLGGDIEALTALKAALEG